MLFHAGYVREFAFVGEGKDQELTLFLSKMTKNRNQKLTTGSKSQCVKKCGSRVVYTAIAAEKELELQKLQIRVMKKAIGRQESKI